MGKSKISKTIAKIICILFVLASGYLLFFAVLDLVIADKAKEIFVALAYMLGALISGLIFIKWYENIK